MKILAFGIAREIIGGSAIILPQGGSVTVAMLKEQLAAQYPALKLLKAYSIAVNGEYAGPDAVMTEADEVAIIPPVSGG